jgi:hypothetical protein
MAALALVTLACSPKHTAANGKVSLLGGGGGTVSGQVVAASNIPGTGGQTVPGAPVPGATVALDGQTTTTDQNGHFTLKATSGTYDVSVVYDAGAGSPLTAWTYLGLGAQNPTLTLPGVTLQGGISPATFAGAIDGGAGFPITGTGSYALLLASSATPSTTNSVQLSVAGGPGAPTPGPAYSGLNLAWAGGEAVSYAIWALQVAAPAGGGLPTAYQGYAKVASGVVDAGEALTSLDATLSVPLSSGNVEGTVNVPAGYALSGRQFHLQPDSNTAFTFQDFARGGGTLSPAITYSAPEISGWTVGVTATATPPGGAGGRTSQTVVGLTPPQTGVTLNLQPVPTLNTPAANATAVGYDAGFAWTNTSLDGGTVACVYQVTLTARPFGSGAPTLGVVTDASKFALPNLASLGVTLPAAQNYAWGVRCVAPYNSVDDVVGPNGLAAPAANDVLVSGPSNFTTP